MDTNTNIQVFCLNLRAPKDCRKYLSKTLRSPAGEPLFDVEAAQRLLLKKFPLQQHWQPATYSISPEEQANLEASPQQMNLLLPFQANLPYEVLMEDATALLFQADSRLKMLTLELKKDEWLRNLYLFLLENAALPCFLRVAKAYFTSRAEPLPSLSSDFVTVTRSLL
ncbi:hypothetical protein [Hymenobacter ruricola]|uniref:Uncharacterized protein n=1 Tax=Hymenobacter ruricola TaxID=2791023 RepID=A0ABS0I5I9_9BACT|nr:hypothetical protein [Hymenobacter ruricola]MBF9222211.1 hypothetical protein [Hymenobacter ruricola]